MSLEDEFDAFDEVKQRFFFPIDWLVLQLSCDFPPTVITLFGGAELIFPSHVVWSFLHTNFIDPNPLTFLCQGVKTILNHWLFSFSSWNVSSSKLSFTFSMTGAVTSSRWRTSHFVDAIPETAGKDAQATVSQHPLSPLHFSRPSHAPCFCLFAATLASSPSIPCWTGLPVTCLYPRSPCGL